MMLLAEVSAATPVDVSTLKPILDAIAVQFNVATIAAWIAGIIAATIGIVFLIKFARKGIGSFMSALKGKLRAA